MTPDRLLQRYFLSYASLWVPLNSVVLPSSIFRYASHTAVANTYVQRENAKCLIYLLALYDPAGTGQQPPSQTLPYSPRFTMFQANAVFLKIAPPRITQERQRRCLAHRTLVPSNRV